jgi:hypothetical protein
MFEVSSLFHAKIAKKRKARSGDGGELGVKPFLFLSRAL